MFIVKSVLLAEFGYESLFFVSHLCLNLCRAAIFVVIFVAIQLVFLVGFIEQNLVNLDA